MCLCAHRIHRGSASCCLVLLRGRCHRLLLLQSSLLVCRHCSVDRCTDLLIKLLMLPCSLSRLVLRLLNRWGLLLLDRCNRVLSLLLSTLTHACQRLVRIDHLQAGGDASVSLPC